MKTRLPWLRSATLIMSLMCVMAGSSVAWGGVLEQTAPPVRKLSRGLANTVTGILELPLTIQSVGLVKGPVAGLSLGLLVGAGAAVTRTLVGVAETLTFPLPLPGSGYGPILQPEFLLQPEFVQGAQP